MINLFQPLHLLIDGNEANIQNRVGINVYAYQILTEIEKITQNPRKAIEVTVLLSKPKITDLPPERLGWRYQITTPSFLWTKIACPLYLINNQQKFNVYFTFSHYLPNLLKIPTISSIMDLSYLIYPSYFKFTDYCKLKYWTAQSLKKNDKVLTISEFSKNEIVKHYHFEKNKIFIAYPGIIENKKYFNPDQEEECLARYKINQPYFLFLGTIQPRKNLINLIKAFEIFKKQYNFPGKLVLAGKIGWKAKKTLKTINDSLNKSDIILTNFISENEKQILLKNTLANINIGFYEGFGIPTLEALQAQCLTLISQDSALEEVVGNLGLKVNPHKIMAITQSLDYLWHLSFNEKQKIIKKNNKQISKFSWQKSAQKILKEVRLLYYEKK